jgi:putative aldouronate transport system permease protein
MVLKPKKDKILFNAIAYAFTFLFAIFCIIPLVIIVSGSLSTESEIITKGYSIIPRNLTFYSYSMIFKYPEVILRAYGVSIFVVTFGTLIALIFMSMTAYVLSRRDFKYRNWITFYFYFTTLFYAGLLPYYILVVRYLNLKNSIFVLIIPGLINVFNLLILKSFVKKDIPDSLPESAKIDGAGDFKIYAVIILPLMKPAIAAIGLFTAISYWNDWWNCMMFIDDTKLYNLQYTLYNLLTKLEFLRSNMSGRAHAVNVVIPAETIKLATTVVTIGPIIFLYPAIQKYFVKGLTIGAVKG